MLYVYSLPRILLSTCKSRRPDGICFQLFSPLFWWLLDFFCLLSRLLRQKKTRREQRETITTTTITIQKENVAPSLFQRRIVQHRECLSSINGNHCFFFFFFFFFFFLLLLLLLIIAVVVLNIEKKSFAIFDD